MDWILLMGTLAAAVAASVAVSAGILTLLLRWIATAAPRPAGSRAARPS